MSKILSATAAIIALSIGLTAMNAAPALATNCHVYNHNTNYYTSLNYAGPVSLQRYYYAPHASDSQSQTGRG
jgi:hypothetical protein